MKRNCLLRVLWYRRVVNNQILNCYKKIKSFQIAVKFV